VAEAKAAGQAVGEYGAKGEASRLGRRPASDVRTRARGSCWGVAGRGSRVPALRRAAAALHRNPVPQPPRPPTLRAPAPAPPPVSALLARLADIRGADPAAKSVIFSEWGRLLRLVGGALKDNGIQFATMLGEARGEAQDQPRPARPSLAAAWGPGHPDATQPGTAWPPARQRSESHAPALAPSYPPCPPVCTPTTPITRTPPGSNLAARQAELHRFQHDPSCPVLLLLMSNSSGAAGLTLNMATTAFILEPAINPGLEAQVGGGGCRGGLGRGGGPRGWRSTWRQRP
jgi:hypothetical protein